MTGYTILRRRPDLGETRLGQLVADTESTLTTHLDTDVQSGTTYIYRVVALRGGQAAPRSNKAQLTYEAPPVSPEASDEHEDSAQLKTGTGEPASPKEPEWTAQELRPTGLVATAGNGFVSLTWDAPEGDADAVDGYEILRRRTNRGEKTRACAGTWGAGWLRVPE